MHDYCNDFVHFNLLKICLSYRIHIVGCLMERSPNFFPFFYPLPKLSFILSCYAHYVTILKEEEIEPNFTFKKFQKKLLINYWKYGPNEWPGNYMINREDEKWPLLFLYYKTMVNYKFVDKLIEAKRRQNSSRIVEGKIFVSGILKLMVTMKV